MGNAHLRAAEKRGGLASDFNNLNAFHSCLDNNGLRDLGAQGHPFTWSNKRSDGFIEERLDRFVANESWKNLFPVATVENVVWDSSDHCPIVMHLGGIIHEEYSESRDHNRMFRFEARWLQFDNFDQQMMDFWARSKDKFGPLWSNVVEECSSLLKKWNSEVYMANYSRMGWLLKRLKKVRKMSPSPAVIEEYRRVEQEIRTLRQQQETAACQRCRPFVIRDGDKNTSYFHTKVSNRRRRNKLTGLEDSNGIMQKSQEGMKNVVLNYFTNLFDSSRAEIVLEDLNFIDNRLSASMQDQLLRPYCREEIQNALAEMHPCKSPGPDGLPALFYKKYWNMVGDDICGVVLDFLNHGVMPEGLNHTHVVLIPKVKKPTKMTELRPISLCNVSYKLISKVLANRLKVILPSIIDENQSAFVPGRLITDNILLSSEVFHVLKNNQAKKRGSMALKLDMSKAYDRMEWDFLSLVMIKMGFPALWIDRVMKCVSSVTFAFLVNGEATDIIVPKRGLRQGDPISPYLFLLGAEGFGALIKKAHAEGNIHGISISRHAPIISHLFFADDSMVFARANVREAAVIVNILRRYEFLSGQTINVEKSEVSFSRGIESNIRRRVSDVLGFKEVLSHDKYLGLPTIFDRSKKISFTGIRDRIWKKLKGWKEKILSRAGKEVLIKAVAQSIPTYAMSCFKLPDSFCDEVEKIIRNFWWGTSSSERGIPWKAWKALCRPKCEGGLGFRDLSCFNSSLLAKQLWRLHTHPQSLLARSLKARYFPSSSIWEAKVGFNPSYAWRSVWGARPILELGTRWRIGDGTTVRIWKDAWIGGDGSGKPISPIRGLEPAATVNAIIDNTTHSWRQDIISNIFLPIDRDRILNTPISSRGGNDTRVWAASDDGIFRVKDAYKIAFKAQRDSPEASSIDTLWSKLWKLCIPPKAKMFLWRAAWDILPHGANLTKKGVTGVENCKRCGQRETNNHVLRDCAWARDVWAKSLNLSSIPNYHSIRDWLGEVLDSKTQLEADFFGACAWQVWTARNEFCFEKINLAPDICYTRSCDILAEYKNANWNKERPKEKPPPAKWARPEVGFIKLNVDAAVDVKEDRVGLGVVARDENGTVILSAAKSIWPFFNVERAEIEAFGWAIELAKERSWDSIIFEGDASNVVKGFQRQISRGLHNQVLIDNALHNVGDIQHHSFNFCFRDANGVAHRLARWAVTSIGSRVWLDGGPVWISDTVISDLLS